ncbi:hypothetical protein DRN69_04485 [Candidatus Pacearchaeota archaeon]|nr:MAG: hypothetical protein DRN69_04485 [Candidatus Pacearchaeota archaeon]
MEKWLKLHKKFIYDDRCKLYVPLLTYMDTARTKVEDISQYHNHGTIYGAVPDEIGFDFDGTDDYIDCGDDGSLDITDAITIEAWVKPESLQTNWDYITGWRWDYILSIGVESGNACKLRWYAADLTPQVVSSDNYVVTFDEFQHVAVTYDSSTGKVTLYRNGIKVGEDTVSGTITNFPGIGVRMGKYDDYPFNGTIALDRIWDIALSEETIKSHYEIERHLFGV